MNQFNSELFPNYQGGKIKIMEQNINIDNTNVNNGNNDNNIYGYMRLSKRNLSKVDNNGNVISDEEQLQRQRMELINAGVPSNHIFDEGIVSGVAQNRVILNKMIGLREYANSQPLLPTGSTLIVTELSRLSRDYNELQIILSRINALNVRLILLDFPMLNNQINNDDTTSKFLNQMMISLLSYLADMERQKLIERTKSGIENAKKNGKKLGRPIRVSNREEISRVYDLYYTQNSITSEMGMKMLGVKKTTFFKYLKEEHCRRYGLLQEQEPVLQ